MTIPDLAVWAVEVTERREEEMSTEEMARFMADLDRGSSMFGALNEDSRARLFALVDNPTPETWDNAYSIILDGSTMFTLWQAVLAEDRTFPTSGKVTDEKGRVVKPWARIPSPDLTMRAVRAAVES